MENFSSSPGFALPGALRLVAACCDHPAGAANRAAVEKLSAGEIDWREVERTAQRHQVQGLVYDRLSTTAALPQALRERWARQARNRVKVNLLQARASRELQALLNDANIPNLVIKGLPLAFSAYGSLSLKRSCDIDLLVERINAPRAIALLAARGWLPTATGSPLDRRQTQAIIRRFKEISLQDVNGIAVDLHWDLVSTAAALGHLDPFEHPRTVEIDNVGHVVTLPRRDEFAYLCVHGALSDWSRLKWLADVNALLARLSEVEIAEYHAHADVHGAGPSVLQALALCAFFWDRPIPPPLAAKIDEIGRDRLMAYPLKRMQQPYRALGARATLARSIAETRMRAILYGSRTAALRDLSMHFAAVPDVLSAPLPPALSWLYLPLRPILWGARKLRLRSGTGESGPGNGGPPSGLQGEVDDESDPDGARPRPNGRIENVFREKADQPDR